MDDETDPSFQMFLQQTHDIQRNAFCTWYTKKCHILPVSKSLQSFGWVYPNRAHVVSMLKFCCHQSFQAQQKGIAYLKSISLKAASARGCVCLPADWRSPRQSLIDPASPLLRILSVKKLFCEGQGLMKPCYKECKRRLYSLSFCHTLLFHHFTLDFTDVIISNTGITYYMLEGSSSTGNKLVSTWDL